MILLFVSAIENVIIDRAEAFQAPTRGNMPRVEEKCTFDRAFPAIVESDLGDRNSIAPMQATGVDRGHPAAANKRKLALLENYAAKRGREPARLGTRHYNASNG